MSEYEFSRQTRKLNGSIKVEYVCRDDVNFHYCDKSLVDKTVNSTQEDHLIAQVIDEIAKLEDNEQTKFLERQEEYFSEHFKRFRRRLPITLTKMDWYESFYFLTSTPKSVI